MNQYRVDFRSIPWECLSTGVRSKVAKGNSKQLRLVEFTKEFIEPDWCMKGHIGYVLEGKLEINFNGTIVTYDPGDAVIYPRGRESQTYGKNNY